MDFVIMLWSFLQKFPILPYPESIESGPQPQNLFI
jgi:hypothetical protein